MIFSRNLEVTRTVVIEFLFEGLLVYFLITNVVKTPRALRLAVWALLLAGFVSAVVPCYQQLTGTFDSNFAGFGQTSEVGFRTGEVTGRGESRQIRLAGSIGEQNRYAQNLLMLLPLGLFAFLSERSKRLRFLAFFFTAVTGAGFLLAFSRGGAVAFLLVLATMVLMRTVSLRQISVVGLVVVLGLVAMPQYWARMKTIEDIPSLFSRTASSQTGASKPDSAAQRRLIEMVAAGMVFADNPVIGVGPGMFKYYSQEYGNRLGIRKITETRKAHSLYLEVAAEGGALGLICLFGVVLVTLHGLIVARRRLLQGLPGTTPGEEHERRALANLVTGFLLALIAYLACGLFLHLAYIRFFYLMLALAAAASGIALSFSSRRSPPESALAQGVHEGRA
jgi:O-antigen ligase